MLNKLGGLIFDPDLRLMVAGRTSLNFRDILDEQRVLLAHLPKGILGEGASALMGAFLVALLQKAALSRADTARCRPYYLYLDEFQNYTTDNIQDILSESRKYGLSLTLAHQYLDQLAPELRSAVLNTTGTLCCFRVGYADAYQLAKEVFPSPEFFRRREHELTFRHLARWPLPTLREHAEPVGWDDVALRLTRLPARQFWVRRRGASPPLQLRTLNMPEPVSTPQLRSSIRALRGRSGALFGRLKQEVQRELERERSGAASRFPDSGAGASGQPEEPDTPLWGN